MLNRPNRLSTSSQIVATVRHGSSYNGQHCRIVALKPREVGSFSSQPGRCAFVVSKKVSKLAVTRNRLKRRYREAVRGSQLPPDVWVVVFPRLSADQAPFSEIHNDIQSWLAGWRKR